MSILPKSIQAVIDQFARLPGIGPKSASRLVFYLLSKHPQDVRQFGELLGNLTESVVLCSECYNWSDAPHCTLCSSQGRSTKELMVVADPLDVIALERTGYDGHYFVLGGVISPVHGIGPDELRVRLLLEKVTRESTQLKEIILALDPSLEGEATALYLTEQLEPFKLRITRLARGLPIGSDLEYADELTLKRAIDGRQMIEKI